MRFVCVFVLAVVLAIPAILFGAADIQQVGREEAATWIRGVIPLPHEIAIGRKVIADAGPLAISLLALPAPSGWRRPRNRPRLARCARAASRWE